MKDLNKEIGVDPLIRWVWFNNINEEPSHSGFLILKTGSKLNILQINLAQIDWEDLSGFIGTKEYIENAIFGMNYLFLHELSHWGNNYNLGKKEHQKKWKLVLESIIFW